jgi:hypothetical protein
MSDESEHLIEQDDVKRSDTRSSSETIELADLPMFWQGRAKALRILLDSRGTPDTYTDTQADTYEECAKELRAALSSDVAQRPAEPHQGAITTEQLDKLQFGRTLHTRPTDQRTSSETDAASRRIIPMTQHEFVVKIEPQFAMSKAELYKKVKAWLEHNGHTAAGHGFEFVEIRHKEVDE